MAGPSTPLIRNCWYVAAWSSEVGRSLLSRRILGEQLLLYRTQDGTAVALHDRCPHRSLPLSKGCLEGDAVRCGYHGLLFDAAGECIEAPPVDKPPRAMRVPAYTLAERGPLLWIWMGDAPADQSAIPDMWWLSDPAWAHGTGQMTIESNYVALQENLLDLSHFTFLHPGNVGTPEYASAPYKVTTRDEVVQVDRFVASCAVPGIYRSTGLGEKRISRRTIGEFVMPGLHAAVAELRDLSPREGERDLFLVRIAHFVTPRDLKGTHYFFAIARDFAIDDDSATAAMRAGALQAFKEDADALEAIAAIQVAEPDFVEMSMKSDQAGVIMRRVLKARAARETAERSTAE
ncbi:MAG TPA: aromatic ring-hydroxylating dioxygenase subunit alpha [Sphingomonas sp.]|nr:aromatic ring-hydroxylating dioxygenase subunit alpha [Sphingomonas sp.]